ncbi:hypothetical protein HPB50_023630 [Hyalomma asiaticum]|uniref:Uncharacterized protein n=1 Tax=Hyalomma asiaticum TaxID=266040 RepID=A0ACB7T754_HYAAI|nr:hypothetical protein HPB50_023630 [Hyalomma asiaticum]
MSKRGGVKWRDAPDIRVALTSVFRGRKLSEARAFVGARRAAASTGTAGTLASGKVERRHSVDSKRSTRNSAPREPTIVWDGRVTCESRRPLSLCSLCAGLGGNAHVAVNDVFV